MPIVVGDGENDMSSMQTLPLSTLSKSNVAGHPQPRFDATRRRPNQEQGTGLELLGHAIEYLLDSRALVSGQRRPEPDSQALQLLKHSSRDLFACCAEVVPLKDRMERWLTRCLIGKA